MYTKQTIKRRKKKSMRKSKNVLPEQVSEFWSLPVLIKDGVENNFSYYYVHSETGQIWSSWSGRYLIPCVGTQGYMKFSLASDEGNYIYTYGHRVSLAAKVGNWDWEQSHHKDRNTANNRPDNLEPRTRKEQFDEETRANQGKAKTGSKNTLSKFTEKEVHKIKLDAIGIEKFSKYSKEVAAQFNVHPNTIRFMLEGKTWKHVEV